MSRHPNSHLNLTDRPSVTPMACPSGSDDMPAVERPCYESLGGLVDTDPWSLSVPERLALVAEFERHAAWFESLRADALAAVAGPGPDFGVQPADADCEGFRAMYAVDDSIHDELAAALRLSLVTTRRRVAVARDLHYKLPKVAQLMNEGACSYAHAAVVSDECEPLSISQAATVEFRTLGGIAHQTPGQMRRTVRRAIAAILPEEPAAQVEKEFARREVTLTFDGGVMATITATLPAPDAISVWNALTVCAHQDPPTSIACTVDSASLNGTDQSSVAADGPAKDPRTVAHRRADALTAWAQRALEEPGLPVMQGKKRLETQVVIELPTLLGLAEEPGELIGYGPIPAILARRLAGVSSHWRRLVTDPVSGSLLDFGTTTYTPPASVREYVLARDRTCQFPGCARPGYQCDIDHVQPFTGADDGGSTNAGNLITLCRRHHRLKTHNHWKLSVDDPPAGSESGGVPLVQWESPLRVQHENPRPSALPKSHPVSMPDDHPYPSTSHATDASVTANPARPNEKRPSGEGSSDERPSNVRPGDVRPNSGRLSDERVRSARPSGDRVSDLRPSSELPSNERPDDELVRVEWVGDEVPSGERPWQVIGIQGSHQKELLISDSAPSSSPSRFRERGTDMEIQLGELLGAA